MSDREFHIRAEIPEPNYERFLDTLAKLNKRAEKIDSPPIEFGLHEIVDRVINEDTKEQMRYFDVEVSGLVPIIEGWTLAAVLDHEYAEGNMIRRVPTEQEIEIDEKWRTADSDCDHCGYDRIRNETFLLWKDGEWKQVGRNCLADFGANERMIRHLEMMERVREALDIATEIPPDIHSPDGIFQIGIRTYLAFVSTTIEEDGWLSKGKAREIGWSRAPTAERALDYIIERRKPVRQRELDITPSDEDYATADQALEWAREDLANRAQLSDYEWNLSMACTADAIREGDFGIVASLIPAYLRASGKWTTSGNGNGPDSEFVGGIGEREFFQLTVQMRRRIDTQYGASDLYIMEDADGNVFKWFTSSLPVKRQQMIDFIQPERPKNVDIRSEFEMEEGWTYRVKGTIKDHEIFNGVKQTALSRCMVQEILTDDTERGNHV